MGTDLGPCELKFAQGEKEARIAKLQEFHLPPSRFSFLNGHYGLRRAKRHVLLGTSGSGKTTLTRSLINDLAKTEKILVYSSEENLEDTKDMLALRGIDNDVLSNISFVHEDEIKAQCGSLENHAEFKRLLNVKIVNSGAKCLFFDNITTSDFYNGRTYEKALAFLDVLHEIIKDNDIPMFMVAHTKKGVKDDQQALIGPDDVKGFGSLTDKCEFLYIYQKFIGTTRGTATPSFGTVRVRKGRGLSNIDSIYLLNFDFNKREYTGDAQITFEAFNKIYKERAKLGGS